MKDLFLKKLPDKVAAYYCQVPQEISEWPKTALTEFLQEYPEFTNEDLQVELFKKDPENGYAVGSIKFRGGALAVPIIIKQFKLAPFDIIVTATHILPLTRENIFTLFNSRSAYGTLKVDDDNILPSIFDPALRAGGAAEGYSYSYKTASLGDYSFIDHISDTVSSDVKKAFLEIVEQNLSLKNSFDINKTAEILEKIKSLTENDKYNVKEAASHALDRDIWYIYKQNTDEYVGIFGNSLIYDPVVVKLSEDEALREKPVKTAKCKKKKKNMISRQKIAVFDIKNEENRKLLVNTEGKIAEVAHYEQFEDLYEADFSHIKAEKPRTGYAYLLKIGNSVSRPLDVIKTSTINNKTCIQTTNGLSLHNYYITHGIKGEFPHETEKNASYLGTDAQWLCVTGDFIPEYEKISVFDEIHRVSDKNYHLTGTNFEKYKRDLVKQAEYSFHDAVWALLQLGGQVDDLYKLSNLEVGHSVNYDDLNDVPEKIDVYSAKLAAVYEDVFKSEQSYEYLEKLVKIAAQNPLKTTVDAVLSLGFINKNNLSEFVVQLPLYEQVTSDMARLLLHIRLGLESVSEEPVIKAMQELTKVIERLRGLNKLNKVE